MEESTNNLKFVADLQSRISPIAQTLIQNLEPGQGGVLAVPQNFNLFDVRKHIPTTPTRIKHCVEFIDVESFITYVNTYKFHEMESIEDPGVVASETQKSLQTTFLHGKISVDPRTIKAIFDFHTSGNPGWCDHSCILKLTETEEYRAWKDIDCEILPQADFAEFLKDNRFSIISPSDASIIELVQNLEAQIDSSVVSKLPSNKGLMLSYTENVNSSVNGVQVTIPNTIRIKIRIFEGTDPIELDCEFRFKVQNGRPVFAIKMMQIDFYIRKSVMNIVDKIENFTGKKVYL